LAGGGKNQHKSQNIDLSMTKHRFADENIASENIHASEGHRSTINAIPWDCLILLIRLQVVSYHGIIIALSNQTTYCCNGNNDESCNQKGTQKSIRGSHHDG
jgi:hypothetical protein